MNLGNPIEENAILNIVRDKFRHDENVISVSAWNLGLLQRPYAASVVFAFCVYTIHISDYCICNWMIYTLQSFQICETYQIVSGGEYKNRILALVAHGDSCGIFSFASSRWPPESFSDLTIECVYPLNEDLKLDASTE